MIYIEYDDENKTMVIKRLKEIQLQVDLNKKNPLTNEIALIDIDGNVLPKGDRWDGSPVHYKLYVTMYEIKDRTLEDIINVASEMWKEKKKLKEEIK